MKPSVIHTYPDWEANLHDLEGITCWCSPKGIQICPVCLGRGGCSNPSCDEGYITVEDLSDAAIITHRAFGSYKPRNVKV